MWLLYILYSSLKLNKNSFPQNVDYVELKNKNDMEMWIITNSIPQNFIKSVKSQFNKIIYGGNYGKGIYKLFRKWK